MKQDVPYDSIADWYDRHLRENPLYDEVILPALLALIDPGRQGDAVLDIACGQGYASRAIAGLGYKVTGSDISERLLDLARGYEARQPLGIRYINSDAQTLEAFQTAQFDGVACNMGLMNVPNLLKCFLAVARVMTRGAWFVMTLAHPAFQSPGSRWIDVQDGTRGRLVRDYFNEGYYETADPAGIRSKVGEYHRTLSTYINFLNDAGFLVERLLEPPAGGRRATLEPGNRAVPSVLALRARLHS